MEPTIPIPLNLAESALSSSESDKEELNDVKLLEEYNQSSGSEEPEPGIFSTKLEVPVFEKIYLPGRGEKTSYDTFTPLEKLVTKIIDNIIHIKKYKNRKRVNTNAFKVFLKEASGYIKGRHYLAKASKKWSEISHKEKEYYKRLADMARCCSSSEQKLNVKKLTPPKARGITNSLMFYIKENRERVQSISDIKALSAEWRSLDFNLKAPYMTMETWDRRRFIFERDLMKRFVLIAGLLHSADEKSIPSKKPVYYYLKQELRKSFLDSGWSETPGLEALSRKHYKSLDLDTRAEYKRIKRHRERNALEEFIMTLLLRANVDANSVKTVMRFSKHESGIDSEAEWENSIGDLEADLDF
jgi:hypothetical protein